MFIEHLLFLWPEHLTLVIHKSDNRTSILESGGIIRQYLALKNRILHGKKVTEKVKEKACCCYIGS